MLIRTLLCVLVFSFCFVRGSFAELRPGFDKYEYLELLKMSARHGDSGYIKKIAVPQNAQLIYTSPVVGLENKWQLWIRNDQVAVISIRGTTASQISWLANFYAGMLPATGMLQLEGKPGFYYHLADNPRAAVHAGWLIAMAYLSEDILAKMDSVYKAGIHDFIVMGHSQGGAISYLLTAYLYNLQHQKKLPADIRIKTYCSAAPKPGNLYFAYDYEAKTQYGWAYNVVNSADWVPETPITVQTLNDYNKTNIFSIAPNLIKKQKFPLNLIARYAFNRLDKPTKRAQRNFEKYLGRVAGKQVAKHLNHFVPPVYYPSADYVRAGHTIVLLADDAYYRIYKDSRENVFVHHFFEPYLYLTAKLPD